MRISQVNMPASTSVSNGAADGLEPRFALSPATPRSSKTSMVVGGVRIYIYGLEELPRTQSSSPHKEGSANEVAVLYLAHNRTRTYKVTEDIAHEILHQFRTDSRPKSMGMIAVTMNMRNHGDREVGNISSLGLLPLAKHDLAVPSFMFRVKAWYVIC